MNSGISAASIGIAVGPDGLTAVLRRGGSMHTEVVPARIDPAAADVEAVLVTALRALRVRMDGAGEHAARRTRVHIALLPPLAESRLLQLPPLRPAEAAAVVRRDAGRYFMNIAAPRVTAGAGASRSRALPVLAAASSATLLEAVHRAAQAVEWQVAGIAPAHGAWLAAAGSVKGVAAVVAVEGGTAHVMLLQDGAPHTLRRVPAADAAEVLEAAGAEAGRLLLFASDAVRSELAARFTAAGWALAEAAGSSAAGAGIETPGGAQAAALHAAAARPQLIASSAEVQRRAQERRTAAWLAAAAVVLLLGSAAVELWGVHRQLDALRGRRAEIRADVGPLLSMRDSVDRLDQHSAAIERIAAGAPRWTAAIFELTMLLPHETHLTRLYTTGDTVIVEAEGNRAGATLQAMRTAGTLRDARLLGSVERELTDGATAVERFRLSARLAGAPPRVPAAGIARRPDQGGDR